MKEARELAKLPFVLEKEFSRGTTEGRILDDGRVLIYMPGEKGALYPTRESLANLMRESAAEVAKGPFDPAKELLPPLADFLRDVDQHAKNLGKVIRVPDEVLDRSIESLNPVYKAVLKLPRAKRLSPEVFTPLTAYVGEVMRLICDGRWMAMPATKKKSTPVYDPEEMTRWIAEQPLIKAAMEQAKREVLARGGSEREAETARLALGAREQLREPKPIRYDTHEVRVRDHEHEPVIRAHDGRLYQPVAAVIKELVENGARGSLSTAVVGRLYIYLSAQAKAGAPG